MSKEINIGQQSLQIAQDFFKDFSKLTTSIDRLQVVPLIEQPANRQYISDNKMIKSIAEIVHDNSISIEVKVQKVKKILVIPNKVEIKLANSQYVKPSDVKVNTGNNSISNPQKGYYVQQSIIVDQKSQLKKKEKDPNQQKIEQIVDSMLNDSIFNKIEEMNKIPSLPQRGYINDSFQKLSQQNSRNTNQKEQIKKLAEENAKLKQQLNRLKMLIESIENQSKVSSNISLEKILALKTKRILTQSILQENQLQEQKSKNQLKNENPIKIQEQSSLVVQINTNINDSSANQKLKEQLQKHSKIITQKSSQILFLRKKLTKQRQKSANISQYIHYKFSKMTGKREKAEYANAIITQVSMFLDR